MGSDRPQGAGDGAGAPLPFILFAGLSRPLPRGELDLRKAEGPSLRPTCPQWKLSSPWQQAVSFRPMSQLGAKGQARDGFRLQEGVNARSTGSLRDRMASGPAHLGL